MKMLSLKKRGKIIIEDYWYDENGLHNLGKYKNETVFEKKDIIEVLGELKKRIQNYLERNWKKPRDKLLEDILEIIDEVFGKTK